MNLQVQTYKGEIQRCSRHDNKQHIRWWKKSKILIALSAEVMCWSCWREPASFQIPNSTTHAFKPKVNFGVFREAVRMSVTQPQTKLWTSEEASAWRKCLKEHQCRLVSMNIWCLGPWVQSAAHYLIPNGDNSSADVNVSCLCSKISEVALSLYWNVQSKHCLFVSFPRNYSTLKKHIFQLQLEVSYFQSTLFPLLIKTFGSAAIWNGFWKAEAYVTGRIMRI